MGITDTLTTHLVIRVVSLVSDDNIPLLMFADVWPPSPLMYVTTGGDMARVAQAACPPLLGAGVYRAQSTLESRAERVHQ